MDQNHSKPSPFQITVASVFILLWSGAISYAISVTINSYRQHPLALVPTFPWTSLAILLGVHCIVNEWKGTFRGNGSSAKWMFNLSMVFAFIGLFIVIGNTLLSKDAVASEIMTEIALPGTALVILTFINANINLIWYQRLQQTPPAALEITKNQRFTLLELFCFISIVGFMLGLTIYLIEKSA